MLVDLRESAPAEADGDETPAPAVAEPDSDGEPNEFDSLIGLDENWSEIYEEGPRRSRAALSEDSDRKQDAMQNMASRPRSFHDDLIDQVSFFDCEPTVRALAEYIIYNLDEKGYFRLPLHDVVRDLNGSATMEQAEEALQFVQRLDPPGVGARDLRECLLLQLTPDMPCYDVLFTLISEHLDDLEHNRLPAIEKKTAIPLEKIKEAIEHLRRLNFRPGASFVTDNSHYVVPDLIVEHNDLAGYDVRLVDENTPLLAISRFYQKQLRKQANRLADQGIHPETDSIGPVADRVDRAAAQYVAEGGPGDHRAPEGLPRQGPGVHRTPEDAANRRPRRRACHDGQPCRGRQVGSDAPWYFPAQALLRRRYDHFGR